jgi:DNA-binding response OmpR family regulator
VQLPRSKPIDLVVLDVNMKGRPGDSVCRMLKNDPASAGARVILVGSLLGTGAWTLMKKAGNDAFVPKPFGMQVLMHTVQTLLKMPHQAVLPDDLTAQLAPLYS